MFISLIIAIFAQIISPAFGAEQVDLPTGIAYPSTNSALFDNPAALSSYQATSFDTAALVNGSITNPGVVSSFVKTQTLGFGVGVKKKGKSDRFVYGWVWI